MTYFQLSQQNEGFCHVLVPEPGQLNHLAVTIARAMSWEEHAPGTVPAVEGMVWEWYIGREGQFLCFSKRRLPYK